MTREWSAIILAGGKGSRLMPLTSNIPKPLVKVTNKPMVDYSIAHLIYADIKHITLALAYMGEKIEKHVKNTWTGDLLGDVELECSINDSKGTADAVRLLTDSFSESEKVIVSMADIVTNLPMRKLMDFHTEKGGIATISMKTVESHISQYGVVLLDDKRKIYLFLEKPGPMELYLSSMAQRTDLFLHTNIINTGIYAFRKDIADVLHHNPNLMDFGGEVFPFLLENTDQELYGFVKNYYWLDCGNAQTYMWANWDLLRKYAWPITPNGKEYDDIFVMGIIDSGKDISIEKPTCFGQNVLLNGKIKIKALSSIGSNVMIGQEAIIEKSVIWENVIIGAGSVIEETIICNDCEIGQGVELKKVVIGPFCKISDNTKLSDTTIEMGQQI
jgi:NDP-sugar pyrophosphorylase family protein